MILGGYSPKNPYQALLPAFFLPNIRFIQSGGINWSSGHEDFLHSVPRAPYVHTSPVTTFHLAQSNDPRGILKWLLSLPKALVEFGYWKGKLSTNNYTTAYSILDVGQLLSKYQSGFQRLESLSTVRASETLVRIGDILGSSEISKFRIGIS